MREAFSQIKTNTSVRDFTLNVVFIDGRKSQQFLVENFEIPISTVKF